MPGTGRFASRWHPVDAGFTHRPGASRTSRGASTIGSGSARPFRRRAAPDLHRRAFREKRRGAPDDHDGTHDGTHGGTHSAFGVRRLQTAGDLLLDLYDGAQEQFLEAYEHMSSKVASIPGTTRLEHDYVQVSEHGSRWDVDHRAADSKLHLAFQPSTLAAVVAERFGARGPVQTVSTGCTSGLDAVGYGFHTIAEGRADVCIAGASDSPISPITMACFDAIKATSPNNDDPEHASRPFDAHRDGFVMGEGAAVLVLEEYEHARARGAQIHCEIGGYATFGNAYHMTGLTTEGLEMARAIDSTLDQARLDPTLIDYVNAHGSGTRQNDRHETAAVKRSLGAHAYDTPMSSIKSMVGHSLGAIGAIEVVACVLALKHQAVPPTANYETPDPECDLDYVPRTARPRKLRNVLSVGSGFGGFQSAVLLTGPGGRNR
ncbi:hypothetical protein SHIRM173S_00239 [Streptomyces hirsutus]